MQRRLAPDRPAGARRRPAGQGFGAHHLHGAQAGIAGIKTDRRRQKGGIEGGILAAFDHHLAPPPDQQRGRQRQDIGAQRRLARLKPGDLGAQLGKFVGGAEMVHGETFAADPVGPILGQDRLTTGFDAPVRPIWCIRAEATKKRKLARRFGAKGRCPVRAVVARGTGHNPDCRVQT